MIGESGCRVFDCNNEGVLFVVARSVQSSDDIDFKPSPELRSQFVPSQTSTSLMLMLQVTYLKRGGVVLGDAINHILADGHSRIHFFQTWASIARDDLNSIKLPSFDNTPLAARSPPSVTFDYPGMELINCLLSALHHPHLMLQLTTKFKLSNEQISSLKSQCKEGRVSTFCVVAALFWKCYCIAEELPPGIETCLFFPACHQNFCSCSSIPGHFQSNSNCSYNTVKSAINGFTDEFIRSFIDCVEVNNDKGLFLAKTPPKSDLRIISNCGMPVYDTDFGWGAPQVVTWAGSVGNRVVCVVNEPGKDAGIAAYVSLDSDIMQKFEKLFHEKLGCNSLQS